MNINSKWIVYILLTISLFSFSCQKYLDLKPDKKLAIPYTGNDLQAILDNIPRINDGESALSEIAADNFFLPYANWQGIEEIENRESYIWQNTPVAELYWSYMYRKIYDSNFVLEYIDKVSYQSSLQRDYIYGNARLIRGIAFQKLAEVFCIPFWKGMVNDNSFGLVLKLSSDINETNKRATLFETHKQISEDLIEASKYLPPNISEYPTRPSKVVAYAALARYLLSIQDYPGAYNYANLSLQIKSTLSNYNNIPLVPYPFNLYNDEILYFTRSYPYRNLSEDNARVDTVLYNYYDDADLRKEILFKKQLDGYHSFVGDYSKSNFEKFTGLTTAEMYLIRAECLTREKKYLEAQNDLLLLLKSRYVSNYDFTSLLLGLEPVNLLSQILLERRKELIGRGVRWTDIRRLAFERPIQMKRILLDKTYILENDDIKGFAFNLPQVVIDRGNYE
ncbi:RagB/SusD family nutrient uptake outer membrane protein [Sphingobacterium bovistauri]|uniref:RagB/SusD family nutrient uptake outer membrane protein n=1 Tax=Sphingobacterium bovistauri TaxID=2781959 RepID=A0ABS7Z7G0_9SPHI|nr:RagB/SusD family nutrient uptake outer membrane protein [Sphingobacterium bovistauri]MCA5006120.1 RagB/SusD family nutrient uptake outer membrane protein [Sphingobacterium bovistauri]